MSAKVTHTLAFPIVLTIRNAKGEERQEITTEVTHPVGVRMKGRDIRAVGGAESDEERTLMLIAHYTGLSMAHIDEMDAEDIQHLSGVVQGFRSGPKTGPTS